MADFIKTDLLNLLLIYLFLSVGSHQYKRINYREPMDILILQDQQMQALPFFDTWNCINCDFHNMFSLSICELCGVDQLTRRQNGGSLTPLTPKEDPDKHPKVIHREFVASYKKISLCESCLFQEPEEISKCEFCKDTLTDLAEDRLVHTWSCSLCNFTKSQENTVKEHIKHCKPVVKKIKKITPKPPKVAKQIVIKYKSQYDEVIHEQNPVDIKSLLSFDSYDVQTLTDFHKQTLFYVNDNFRKLHNRARQGLLDKIKQYNYTEDDLCTLQDYFKNRVPLVIHVNISRYIECFVKDTHYRSQFQTGTSSGTLCRKTRISWENRMFHDKYNEASDFDRVKYGVVNFYDDNKGVKVSKGYGNSYFLLKDHVRGRSTFTEMDSSNLTSAMGSFAYPNHVLMKFTDDELKIAVQAAKGIPSLTGSAIGTYKQLQIHGSLRFDRDIEKLFVSKLDLFEPKFIGLVEEFCKKFNVPYQIMP